MSHTVCPYWAGFLLAGRLRRLVQNPERLLVPFVSSGMTVLEVGPGMGFFSIPMARLVGAGGRVVCVDVQEKMIRALERRALRAGVADRIAARVCQPASLGIEDFRGRIDLAFLFAMVHEVPDAGRLFGEVADALRPEGRCLVAEPRLHVPSRSFEATVALALQYGLRLAERPTLAGSHAALMTLAAAALPPGA